MCDMFSFLRTKKINMDANDVRRYRLIAFDIDGTITESKMSIDNEMASLLCMLLRDYDVALVSGASYVQMVEQIVERLPCESSWGHMWLVPVSGALLYGYTNGVWACLDSHVFTAEEDVAVRAAFAEAFVETGYRQPETLFGDVFESRGGQVTFSALGQHAPVAEKEAWNKTSDVRPALKKALSQRLLKYEIRSGGMTSIDVTKKGIDKAFAIENLVRFSGVPISDVVYVGDALYPGGNDETVKKSGVQTIAVTGPEDTKVLIREILFYTDKRKN